MSESAETASFDAVPADAGQAGATGLTGEHPEVLVGAAFLGGLALATILKRLAR
jgi:hypothetical protein